MMVSTLQCYRTRRSVSLLSSSVVGSMQGAVSIPRREEGGVDRLVRGLIIPVVSVDNDGGASNIMPGETEVVSAQGSVALEQLVVEAGNVAVEADLVSFWGNMLSLRDLCGRDFSAYPEKWRKSPWNNPKLAWNCWKTTVWVSTSQICSEMILESAA